MEDFDLETGDIEAAEAMQQAATAARARRTATRKSTAGRKTKAAKDKEADATLVTRCQEAFTDLSHQFKENDPELADILERRAEAMARGLESMTRTVRWLRGPLVFFLSFLEPVIAFWELATLFAGRYVERRQRKAAEKQYREQGIETIDGVPVNAN